MQLTTTPNGGYDAPIELSKKVAKLQGSQQMAYEKGNQVTAGHYQSQLSWTESALLSREEEME